MDLNNRRTGKDATKPHALGLLGHSVLFDIILYEGFGYCVTSNKTKFFVCQIMVQVKKYKTKSSYIVHISSHNSLISQ